MTLVSLALVIVGYVGGAFMLAWTIIGITIISEWCVGEARVMSRTVWDSFK